MTDVKNKIANLIKIDGVSAEEIVSFLAVPPDPALGDYSLPCFRFAKVLRKSPVLIAEELALKTEKPDFISEITAVNGYLNFRLNKDGAAEKTVRKILSLESDYGTESPNGKTVCLDYSSVNIAKPFHIGHLLTTVIGASLYRIHKKLGYNAIGINHLGDWGTQFGKLIYAFKHWSSREDLEKRGMTALTEIYVKFHKESEKDPSLDDEARHYFRLIEEGDPEATELFNLFKEITLKEVQKTYKRLNVDFDSYNGESFYNDKMQPVLDELEKLGLLTESEGAKVVDLSAYDMPPCLLVKADGATLYATRDLAAAFYRKNTYNFDKCLYVVAYQQNLHFKQVFKVLELMGKDWAKDMIHVSYGMVSLEDGAMSTRQGKVVLLEDVLNRAAEKSLEIITAKNPNLENKEEVAEQVGVGAVVFSALYNNRIKDMVFSYDKVLNFDGETAPYVQYTAARCKSVVRKSELDLSKATPDFEGLNNPESIAVTDCLERFPEVLRSCVERYEPCYLARYLVELCREYNRFYLNNRILNETDGIKTARVMLTECVRIVLEEGLRLLGISAPEKM